MNSRCRRPRLVGVDDESRSAQQRGPRDTRSSSPSPPSLSFSSGRCARLRRVAAAIASGVPRLIVIGGGEGRGCGRPSEFQTPLPERFGLQVPQRAIERVAGRTRRHRRLQGGAVESRGERVCPSP